MHVGEETRNYTLYVALDFENSFIPFCIDFQHIV